jgi:hypothetical protein
MDSEACIASRKHSHVRNTSGMLALCSATFPKLVEHMLDALAIEVYTTMTDHGFDGTDMFPMGT